MFLLTEIAIVLALTAPPPAEPHVPGRVTTVEGEVVDTTCFLIHEAKGPEHKDCAVTCVRAGSPAAILEARTGRLIYALAPISEEMHHSKRPDEALLPYVGRRVRVTGHLLERAGVRAIVTEKVEAVGSSP
jgi:hypothetical protein